MHATRNVMLYGCFGDGKVDNLLKLQEIMNQKSHHSILECNQLQHSQCLM